ncbi:MAG: outer membrane protein assembly factor BamB family protein [Paracoccaceae bacterium]
MHRTGWIAGLGGIVFLSACAAPQVILPGVREDLRAVLSTGIEEPASAQSANLSQPINLPAQTGNTDWSQKPNSARTRTENATLSARPQLAWSANIGEGDGKRQRINTDPVAGQGRIFTLDAGATVTATSTEGTTLWARDLTPSADRSDQASGGGIALSNGVVYVSTSFGLLSALDAASGELRWQQKLEATGSGTPTVQGDLVYLVSGGETAWAIETATGRVRWQTSTAPDQSNVLGGSAPVVTDQLAIFAFGNGEVQATFRQGGLRVWDAVVSGQRRFSALARVADITGDPVLAGDTLYVGTHSGRMVALNAASGERLWTAQDGAISPVWVAGGSVFAISDRNELIRLDAGDGARIWGVKLPNFTETRPRRQVEVVAHYGPILAGGQLVVASNDGQIRFFDPVSGAQTHAVSVPGGATTSPIVAGGTLYVVGAQGQLHAFR